MSSSAVLIDSDRFDDVGGTTFDQFAKAFLRHDRIRDYPEISASMELRNLTILKRLAALGSEFSKPFNTMYNIHPICRCESFADEVEEYTYFERHIDRQLPK